MANKTTWNWQQKDWPSFTYNPKQFYASEETFLRDSGVFIGSYKHIREEEKTSLVVELMSDEALKTSEIEGEILNRQSVQSSIRRNLGLDADERKIPAAEQGIAQMSVDLYKNFSKPLSHDLLFKWHKMLMKGRNDIAVGKYRIHTDAMQVVSGPLHKQNVHFEAPPSSQMQKEMTKFISWFNDTAPNGKMPIPALTRASIAHLYFVCIHPFEDGNGRIGRAIAEKILSQATGQPTLVALSKNIADKRNAYYDMLEKSNKSNSIDAWIEYFSSTILEAQKYTIKLVEFLIEKTKFYDRFRGQFNERQLKVIARIFKTETKGFEGGLSADKYISITGTSRATATRDLQDLVEKGAFNKTGVGRGTRYNICGFSA